MLFCRLNRNDTEVVGGGYGFTGDVGRGNVLNPGEISQPPVTGPTFEEPPTQLLLYLVDCIVAVGAADQLFLASSRGDNPLHRAAMIGNTIDARVLVEQSPDMTQVPNSGGYTPLNLAAWHRNKDTLRYLLKVTDDKLPEEEGSSLYTGVAGGDLITLTIHAGFLDVALEIIAKHPNIVIEEDGNSRTALEVLVIPINKRSEEVGQLDLFTKVVDKKGFHLSLEAITQRQEQVYNILFQSDVHKAAQATLIDKDEKENSLHKAAKLAPPHRIIISTGAALQMQRELQWYKVIKDY
ncbi:hypothetical protein L1987_04527 [Smallanthus sonchifolius]|uniref:Uncharacterized protein n=1 Tax=Smallanthus sonchifolius TaxID=185202 RepID=A0ACB9JSZ9_9ASTR|nr:hypothetical protein L1987_04527 [Smallanthus sonchifolius]